MVGAVHAGYVAKEEDHAENVAAEVDHEDVLVDNHQQREHNCWMAAVAVVVGDHNMEQMVYGCRVGFDEFDVTGWLDQNVKLGVWWLSVVAIGVGSAAVVAVFDADSADIYWMQLVAATAIEWELVASSPFQQKVHFWHLSCSLALVSLLQALAQLAPWKRQSFWLPAWLWNAASPLV